MSKSAPEIAATRTEQVCFRLTVDKIAAEVHADDIALVNGTLPPRPGEGDTLRVSYRVFLHYFGDVAERLAAVRRLLAAPDVTVETSLEELRHGQCIFADVAWELGSLQRRLRERQTKITPT